MLKDNHKKIVKVVDIIRSSQKPEKSSQRNEDQENREADFFASQMMMEDSSKKERREKEDDFFDIESRISKRGRARSPQSQKKSFLVAGGVVATLAVVWWLVSFPLARVTINLTVKKIPWEFENTIALNTQASEVDLAQKQIPAEMIVERKNYVEKFTPSGKKYIEQKSKGTVSIFNAYNTSPQLLVINTRLRTPDGKIFRIDRAVTVPGAKIAGGVLQPSSVAVTVTAGEAGSGHNIGPTEKFTIPGFEGTARFNGFYASSQAPMAGGFIGDSPFPTPEDEQKALEQAESLIKEKLMVVATINISRNFIFRENSEKISITKKEIIRDIDAEGKFSVATEGEISLMVFREDDIKNMLLQIATQEAKASGEYEPRDEALTYGLPQIDWKIGKASLPIEYRATFVRKLDESSLKSSLAGKNEVEMKSALLALPGVEKLTVSFRPPWKKTSPGSPSQIHIVAE